jgi:hypothetical protein
MNHGISSIEEPADAFAAGRDVYWAAQTCALSCPLSRPQSDETAPGKEGGPARARHADVSVIPQACRRGLATFFFDGCCDRARPGITR